MSSKKERSKLLLESVYQPKLKELDDRINSNTELSVKNLHEILFELLILKELLESTKGIKDTYLLDDVGRLENSITTKIHGIQTASQQGGRRRRPTKTKTKTN